MASKKTKGGYDGKIAGLYDLEETIGKGHFAVVKLARHVFTGEKVAVKVIDKTKLDEVSRSHLFQEVRCMKLVQHPNVVRLYEVIDTQTKLYLILELGDGGDMYDYIMRHAGGLEEKVAKRYFRQIVEAISYCHKLHVVHRDLKPENVVFFEKLGLVKLTDFGFSNMFAPGKKLETSCGSLAYSAPEILLGDSYDAPAVDVWSLGVILYMLVVGEPPFHEANDSETLTMIMDCKYKIPPHISDVCRDLIGKMLQREPNRRASLASIMSHEWMNDGDLTPICHFQPLLTKEMISEDDQNYVIQRMVEGKIASHEEITSSLEKNAYNYITATYYLLVERRLRKHQQHEHTLLSQQPSSGSLRKQSAPSPSRTSKPHLEPLMLSPRTAPPYMPVSWNGLFSPPATVTFPGFHSGDDERNQGVDSGGDASGTSHYVQSLVSPPGTHPSTSASASHLQTTPSPSDSHNLLLPPGPSAAAVRKCSLIREESLDEYEDEDDECDMDPAVIKPVKSLESLDDYSSGIVHSGHLPSPSSLASSPGSSTSPDPLQSRPRPLKSVCSSPQLLNQIHEENESEDDDDFVPLKLTMPRQYGGRSGSSSSIGSSNQPSNASPEILRKYEQRKKRRGTQRGTSCSSSDASDTDDTEGRSRKDKLRHKFVHRRDSSDHSSDTDGPSGPGLGGNGRLGSGGGGSGGGTSRRTHNGSGGGGGGGGGNNKGSGNNDKKENSGDGKNHSNNKESSNNNKNSRFHCNNNSQGSKGSLTDSSLKLLTRKLSDISNGVGSLLTDCRGSDCDTDSPSRYKTPSNPPTPDRRSSLDRNGSVGSGSLTRHSRNTSLRSNASSRSGLDSNLYPLSEKVAPSTPYSPKSPSVQYLGQSMTDMDSVCGQRQSQEFSEISSMLAEEEMACRVAITEQCRKLSATVAPCRATDAAFHCKPNAPSGVPSVVPVKSKCCSVV